MNFRRSVSVGMASVLATVWLGLAARAAADVAPGSMDVRWSEGAPDCTASTAPLLQIHRYNDTTYILRQELCATFEAPFLYLLIGSSRALLVDTGDVSDAKAMPLADTVQKLLPDKLPLLVVHTHRHSDHRAGDGQFAGRPNVEVVGYDIDSVKHYYGFTDWPNGQAQIDLGGRIVDALPTPGHNETEVSFYDRDTTLFLSGDFLMPARLLIDDAAADLASAQRVADFVKDRPVAYVLGGHIELDDKGEAFDFGSTYHPHERPLPLAKADLLALPAIIASFNGFYSQSGMFIMLNQTRQLYAFGTGALVVLGGMIYGLWRSIRWWRRRRRAGVIAFREDRG